MKLPCAGAIVALRGKDGKLLWKTDTYSEIFELLCHGIDVNQDGSDDCIATGRLADMRAIDPKTGNPPSPHFRRIDFLTLISETSQFPIPGVLDGTFHFFP